LEKTAKSFKLDVLGKIPLEGKLAAACDKGEIELFEGGWLTEALEKVKALLK
jgi:hypothetical protein